MGCGCKDDKPSKKIVDQESEGLNLTGQLLKIPAALLMTVFLIILSPFLLVMIWYMAIKNIFGKESNLIDLILSKFNKKIVIKENVETNEFNDDDYEIVGIDIIK